jgi:peptidylprolyl isomerase
MAQARPGDKVRIHYTGRFDGDRVFDSSVGGDPLEFTLGEGSVIPGVEQAVVGMEVGEEKTLEVSAGEAYGGHRPEKVAEVGRDQFPPEIDPQPGQQLQVSQQGETFLVTVTDVSEATVTLDANHPLAGKDLTFDVELVEIV